jgi:hypothetical protein
MDTRNIKYSHDSGLIFRMFELEGKIIRETEQKRHVHTIVKEKQPDQIQQATPETKRPR